MKTLNQQLSDIIKECSDNTPLLLSNEVDIQSWYRASMLFQDIIQERDQRDNIVDFNARIGFYLDNIEFNSPDVFNYVLIQYQKNIKIYLKFAQANKMKVEIRNIKSLINYKEGNAIFRPHYQ